MAEVIDWTKMLELFERTYLQAVVMSEMLNEKNVDWDEFDKRVSDPSKVQEIRQEFDLLYQASRGGATLQDALRDFSKLHRPKKAN